MCNDLKISRSGYYGWLGRKDKLPDKGDIHLKDLICRIVLEFVGYGYRRVTHDLRRRGYVVNHKKVLRLMREANLLCRSRRKKFRTTMSSHGLPIYPNMANEMELTSINQLWVSDITYISVSRRFLYLSILLDAYSRKCVGWHLSSHIDTDLALTALRKAFETRNHLYISGMVHHSDRGVQYASFEYTECLKLLGVNISMSRVGNPYDNAYAESFIKTLKYEEVYQTEYESYKEAYEGIGKFIELYNGKRLHSSLGYMSPDEFEEQLMQQQSTLS
jgi:transposase InsO family protein